MADLTETDSMQLRVAVVGCGHGALDEIYSSVAWSAKSQGWPNIDLVIINGDFQAVRNARDLNTMSVPMKYRTMGDFHQYYSGAKTAPYLTIFAGGNHEASGYMRELFYGGWAAPNIYYIGAANVLKLGPLRIAGMSGIWKAVDYRKGHFERLPFNDSELRKIYHVREFDVRKLLQIRTQVDVGLSHDWPNGIEWLGNSQELFQVKQYFLDEAQRGELGNPAAEEVLDHLRPPYWFSAHMHVRYPALKDHSKSQSQSAPPICTPAQDIAPPVSKNEDEIDLDMEEEETRPAPKNQDEIELDMDEENARVPAKNQDEIDLDLDEDASIVAPGPTVTREDKTESQITDAVTGGEQSVSEALRAQLPEAFRQAAVYEPANLPYPEAISNTMTNFLALDKPTPNRSFLQLLTLSTVADAPAEELARPLKLQYDPEWLAILRAFGQHDPAIQSPPNKGTAHYQPLVEKEMAWVKENLVDKNSGEELLVPENFCITAPVHDHSEGVDTPGWPREYNNPQTIKFCELVGIKNWFYSPEEELEERYRNAVWVPPQSGHRGGFHNSRGGRGGGRGRGGGER